MHLYVSLSGYKTIDIKAVLLYLSSSKLVIGIVTEKLFLQKPFPEFKIQIYPLKVTLVFLSLYTYN